MGNTEVCSFKFRICSLQFSALDFFIYIFWFYVEVQYKILKIRMCFKSDMIWYLLNLEQSTKLKTVSFLIFTLSLSLSLCIMYIYTYIYVCIHILSTLQLYLNYLLNLKHTELYYIFCSNPLFNFIISPSFYIFIFYLLLLLLKHLYFLSF